MPYNPWEDLDIRRAQQFSEFTHEADVEISIIQRAYKDVDQPRPCDCTDGAKRHYRITVGAFQCPECRTIELADGRVCRS